ncbi:hypothetical protein BJX96DRAFT_155119 [Aspergillus floccosus]
MSDIGAPTVGVMGLTGWEIHSARAQEDRSRRPGIGSTAPEHLTRAFYIPHHDESTSRLSVYDISSQYREAVGQSAIGSARYILSLGRMPKPHANGGASVYNVDFTDVDSDAADLKSISVVPSPPIQSHVEANVTIETARDKASVIRAKREQGNTVLVAENTAMSMSYPIPPTTIKDGFRRNVFEHPYFAFQIPGQDSPSLEWQIHPALHGRLRYSLVQIPPAQSSAAPAGSGEPPGNDIFAIYHHIGEGVSLPLPYSEGILLLSSDMDAATETNLVASVFGMLWRLRRLCNTGKGIGTDSKSPSKGRFGLMKGLLNRK